MTKREGKQILTLEGAVTIGNARKLATLLDETLEDGAPLEVESARLEDIDTCILQLLCSLKKSVPELTFADPSEVFLSVLEASQLRRALLGRRETL
jgi:anti-anti-sigma regulatory factor